MNIVDIRLPFMALGYLLLLIPFGMMLWYGVPLLSRSIISIVRMTVQLLFVALYLQFIFQLNYPLLNIAWLAVMMVVADLSIIKGINIKIRPFLIPLFIALFAGTTVPLLVFLWLMLEMPGVLDAQYVIPVGGMILGNCLRTDIIGLRTFYGSVRKMEKIYLNSLAQGAQMEEALKPYKQEALESALSPLIASLATYGLVTLPGMMTGVILGGADPFIAIKYQIAIMVAIFSGTAITVFSSIWLTSKKSFDSYGMLNKEIFRD